MEELKTDKPRKLTEEEISDILGIIPEIKSAADTVSVQNTKSMKVLLREQLQDIKITPLGISDLKDEILRQFDDSLVRAGAVVGITAAEALGKNVTQGALNSFHSSGSAKNVTHGVERIKELVDASKNPKNTYCSIYFKDQHLSFDDIIIKKRPEITEITVNDLLIGIPDVESTSDLTEPYWYSIYREIFRKKFESKSFLKLEIDTNLLYAYKLTMEDVCFAIENDQPVICVYSPMVKGIIHIYPIENSIANKLNEIKSKKINIEEIITDENLSLIFLSVVVIPSLDKLKISGITGIKQIYPVEASVLQIVKDEQKDHSRENGWFIILNPIRMKITGITVEKLAKLLEVSDIKITKKRPNYIAVDSVIPPLKKIRDLIEEDRKEEKAYSEAKKKEGAKLTRRPPSEISIHSQLIYADSKGTNLKELLSHPDIDSTRTICNNMFEVKETLGIEAARNFLIKEFIDVIGYEGYINPRHIVLMVDYMTSLGNINGVTFTGFSRQPIGALEKATFQKAMSVFKEAGGFGEENPVSGVSSSIYIGKKGTFGTGYDVAYLKPENLKRYHETRKELISKKDLKLDANNFNDAVETLNTNAEDLSELDMFEKEMFTKPTEKVKSPIVGKTTISEDPSSTEPMTNIPIRGKIVRSTELEEISEEMKQTPCLCPIKEPRKMHIESGGFISESIEVPSSNQLPAELAQELEELATSKITFIPPPKLPKFEKPKTMMKFNLDEFNK
jgi:RNA polymerase Rpb1, domain 5